MEHEQTLFKYIVMHSTKQVPIEYENAHFWFFLDGVSSRIADWMTTHSVRRSMVDWSNWRRSQ